MACAAPAQSPGTPPAAQPGAPAESPGGAPGAQPGAPAGTVPVGPGGAQASPSGAPAWVPPAPTSEGRPSPAADALNLKHFGFEFFATAPAETTVAPNVPIPGNYRLGENDKLRIRYWAPAVPETTVEASVAKNGGVVLPGLGEVQAAGLTREQFRQRVGERLREHYKNVSFSAELIETRTITVFVTGAARRPGRYTVKAEANLFNVVYAAGGASDEGSLRRILLRRRNRQVAELDAYQFLTGGILPADTPLEDQDVVVFPVAGARVVVGGEVARPAIYEIREGDRVADALALAGGMRASAYPRILRLRRVEGGRRVERTLDAQALLSDRNHADNLVLRDGDVLTLENVTSQVRERVSVRGNVSFPGDYSIQRTPTAKALLAEARPRVGTYWQRADLTRVLPDGTPVVIPLPLKDLLDGKAEDVPLEDLDEVVVYRSDEKGIVALASIEGAVKHPATFRLADGMRVSDLIFAAGGVLQEASDRVAHLYRRVGPNEFRIIRITPKEAVGTDDEKNPVLRDEDRLVIYRQKEVEYRYDKVMAVGEVQRPGELSAYEGMTLYDAILLAGGPTNEAAGTVEVATPTADGQDGKRTEVKTFPLEEVMGGKHRDEPVRAGMLISLPRRADKLSQPAKVELRGRFRRPGTYALLHEGEDLQSLIERAGGLAEDADPFGMSLTRTKEKMLSTATSEQVRTVMQAMDQLLPAAPQGAQAPSGTTMDVIQGEESGGLPFVGGSQRVERLLLVSPRRLTSMPSNTRIGFQLEDRQSYIARMGKIRLCDGDVVEVPRLSDVVQVLGAVQSPGPVLYNPKWTPKRYLSSAGGGAPDADLRRSVVIKVAGGVRPFRETKQIEPGDVIVVASKHQVIQPPMRRNVRDVFFDLLGVALVLRGLR